MQASQLLDEVVSAHGGHDSWSRIRSVSLNVRGIFPLMMVKGVLPRWRNYSLTVDLNRPRVVVNNYLNTDCQGVFDHWQTSITDADGRVETRSHFDNKSNGSRFRWYWDAQSFLFFIGYAIWQYKRTPFVFLDKNFQVRELTPVKWRGQWLRRMDVIYPDVHPRHCKTQRYFVNEAGLIERFDYTADVIGGWARGAHLCKSYQSFSGIQYPTRREVYGAWIPSMVVPFPPAVLVDLPDIEFNKSS